MTNAERWIYYESGDLQRKVAVDLLDWAGYWATQGTESITDPLQRAQTNSAITLILNDLSYSIKVVSALAISDDAIKSCPADNVPESTVHTVTVSIMASKLAWITGITVLPEND